MTSLSAKQRNPSRRGAISDGMQLLPDPARRVVAEAAVPSAHGSTVTIRVPGVSSRIACDTTAAAFLSAHDLSTAFATASCCAAVHRPSGLTEVVASAAQVGNCHSSLLLSANRSCGARLR
jgi:siroheme synthase